MRSRFPCTRVVRLGLTLLVVAAIAGCPGAKSTDRPDTEPATATVRGTVWWILSPDKPAETPGNRKPADGVAVQAWSAKQAGMVSQAGEPARPSYTMDKHVATAHTDAQGKFEIKLPPGRYFLQGLGDRIVPVESPCVEVQAGQILPVELLVTGGV